MNGVSSPPRSVRTEALSFFSAEEVARARAYHRPLYWAGTAGFAIEAGGLAAAGAGAPGPAARRGGPRVRSTPPFVPGARRLRTTVQPVFTARRRGAGGGAAQTRRAGRSPRTRRARPGHEPPHPEGERIRVRVRANTARRRLRH